MALRTAQLAFDRLISDVGREVLRSPINDGHATLLRSSFQKETKPLIPKTSTLTHDEQEGIAETARTIFRYHCWINLLDPRWDYVKERMIKYLSDGPAIASLGPAIDPDAWAPAPPRGSHLKGQRVPCILCGLVIFAPQDHLSFHHGIDIKRGRYVTRETHITRMQSSVLVQHLIQDGAELNRLQGQICQVEGKLERLNVGYRSIHGLPLHVVYEIDRDHPSFAMTRQPGQSKQALVDKLVNLREDGLRRGNLYTRQGQGTYSEVLADLQMVLDLQMALHGVDES